ncbi:MAG: lysophospholipid acyltransferase family protein, partial [Candidatus Methylomirabilis sp.]|nr:lysophospholipid acyltransferase family protein [Deltaproteobacteria bacterium]
MGFVPRLFWALSYLFFGTTRTRSVDKRHFDRFLARREPIIWACHHQGVLLLPFHLRDPALGRRLAMVSASTDGDVIVKTMRMFGQSAARGSSTRYGKKALEVMIDMLKEGNAPGAEPHHGLFTVDGPKGPAGVAKLGAIILAKETGLPIVPVNWWASPRIALPNWDRTLLPVPFGRMAIAYEEPIFVPADASPEDMERLRALLEERLHRALENAKAALSGAFPDAPTR